VLAGAGIAVILGLGGVGAWAALSPDTYPGSTGGSTIHYCGAQAKSFCRTEYAAAASDQIAVRARPQCRLAGINP
jgi:hypothetical protein